MFLGSSYDSGVVFLPREIFFLRCVSGKRSPSSFVSPMIGIFPSLIVPCNRSSGVPSGFMIAFELSSLIGSLGASSHLFPQRRNGDANIRFFLLDKMVHLVIPDHSAPSIRLMAPG